MQFPNQNPMNYPQSGINLPSMSNLNPMSNQNNRLPHNQQAASQSAAAQAAAAQAAAGGAPPFMHPMVMPGYNPGFFQPVYLMDHNNQIHMVNIQMMQQMQAQQIQAAQMLQTQRYMAMQNQIPGMRQPISNNQQQLQSILMQHHQQQAQQQQRMNELKQAQDLQHHDQAMRHGHDLKNIRINPLSHFDEQQQNQINQTQTNSGHDSGQATMSGNERSNMEPNVHNVNVKTPDESVISLQRQSTLKHPRPLVPDVSTNDPSVREDNQPKIDDFEPTETHSMIIEGGNDALRLDINVDRFGKPVKVGVSNVEHWITKKDNSGHKNDEDGYKTEDEVVFSHPTKINRNADRLISTAQVNSQKIEELSKSYLNASLHSRTLDRTGVNCPSVSSINKSRLSRSRLNRSVSQSFSQRKYNHNPGGQTMARRRRGVSQENLYHIDTPPAPPSAPQPTPVDPISESELPTNPGSTPRKTRYTNRKLSVDEDPDIPIQQQRTISKDHENMFHARLAEIATNQNIRSCVRRGPSEIRLTQTVRPPRTRLSSISKTNVKPTSAATIMRSRESRAARRLPLGLPLSHAQSIQNISYNTVKPKSGVETGALQRCITHDPERDQIHISFSQKEEVSSDTKKKSSIGKRLKIFSTGWKQKHRKAAVDQEASDRLRRSGKQISASLRAGMIEDPAIIQSKMLPPRPSSSKLKLPNQRG